MNSIKILSSDDIKTLVSMSEAIDAVEKAFGDLSTGNIQMPIRTITDFGADNLSVFYKPSFSPTLQTIAIKLLSHRKQGGINGNPALQGSIMLIDSVNNTTKAIIDAAYLTALRTGASSGVATKYLSRENSKTLALFGTGAQAYSQLEAICCVREIEKVYIYSRTSSSVIRFIDEIKNKTKCKLCVGTPENIAEADIICTATASTAPLFCTSQLKNGVHINAIGSYSVNMQEMPDDIFLQASLFVDHKESCFSETADILRPLEKKLLPDMSYKGEIGELINGKIQGRQNEYEITVFKSVGVAVQDLYTADLAYAKACENGVGISTKDETINLTFEH